MSFDKCDHIKRLLLYHCFTRAETSVFGRNCCLLRFQKEGQLIVKIRGEQTFLLAGQFLTVKQHRRTQQFFSQFISYLAKNTSIYSDSISNCVQKLCCTSLKFCYRGRKRIFSRPQFGHVLYKQIKVSVQNYKSQL